MSEKTLQIFELCQKLTELLDDKEAIADLNLLYEKHPEMFKDMQEVSNTIKEVVSEPEIAVDANRDNRDYKVVKVAKILNNKKMADVVIKNESGINEIFHTNKKRIKEFERLKNQENLLQVETPTPSTRQLNGLELMDKNPSGAKNALSATAESIIPQNKNQSQIFDMNDDSALKAIKSEMSSKEEKQEQKTLNNVKNKINEGGALLFSRLPELPIIARLELADKALNIEATSDSIITQKDFQSQTYDPNDSSAMDMFGKEHFEAEEKAKQETRDKEQDTQSNVRQQR